jgi:hypothetical protein
MGSIVCQIYPVRVVPSATRKQALASIGAELDQWYLNLPESLRFDIASWKKVPPPHILFLHITYWGTVILLNRAL